MRWQWLDKTICYDGRQLRSHWIYEEVGLLGSAIVAFTGPADVPLANMVDIKDVRERAPIFSRSMLHFIAEHFDCDLRLGIVRQRLLTAIVVESLEGRGLKRRGDDIFIEDKKLSVSIATASPVSTLIHFGMNIESEGTPIPTIGLADLHIEPRPFADDLMRRYCAEIESMQEARCKVRAVT